MVNYSRGVNMANFGDRLRELRKASGLTQRQLASITKLGESSISMYESEKREPDFEVLELLADFFNVDTNYILGRTESTTFIPSTIRLGTINRRVPVYGRIAAGVPFEALEDIIGEIEVPSEFATREDLFGLLVVGDSMSKIIPDGYFALLQKTDTLENGAIGAIRVNGHDATLKKFFTLTDYVVLEPLSYNPDHKPMIIGKEGPDIHVIGKLLWSCAAKGW